VSIGRVDPEQQWKNDFHIHVDAWSNVLTARSGSGSVDDVIVMAWVGARLLRGSNAL